MKILVVDDERIERDGIRFLIKTNNINLSVEEAENGEKALEIMRNSSVDILFTDIKMPLMGGLELAAKARILNPDLKIILFSAYGEFEYAKEAIKLDVDYYILKPVNVEEFIKTISDVIEECMELQKKKVNEEMLLQVYQKTISHEEMKFKTGPVSANYKGAVSKVIDIIREEYAHDLSLEYLAEKVFLTPGYLSSLFRKVTGQSTVSYITNYRLEEAKKLLTNTNMKIVDISKSVGYLNTSYFCSLFKSYYGVPPGQYRERTE